MVRALRCKLAWIVVAGLLQSMSSMARAEVATAELAPGRVIYNARCYFCHGYAGDARTVAASYLRPPPRDFTRSSSAQLSREQMIRAVRIGRPGTAMQGFSSLLSDAEIDAVVDFVRMGFMAQRAQNIGYHSAPNGWRGDPHASPAAPFASGELSADGPIEELTARQRKGRSLFLSACVSCHGRGPDDIPRDGLQEGLRGSADSTWRIESVSYPEGNYVEHDPHALRPATAVFERHQNAPDIELRTREREGARLYAQSCAACHAGDGSGRNWIGGFLDPPPPDFTRAQSGPVASRVQVAELIRNGVAGTAMPAWRNALDEPAIEALTDYLRRAFPRFQAAP